MVSIPFQWGAAIRHRRALHPDGVLAHGSIERMASPNQGLPIATSADVVARVSKAIGTPGALPDAIGLAIRLPPQPVAVTPWDILLASAGSGVLTRAVGLRPVIGWSRRTMSSLMPLRYEGRNWWLRARMTTDISSPGVALGSVRDQLSGSSVQFDIDQAPCLAADFSPAARLTLNDIIDSDRCDVAFDPVLHTAPGVQLWPQWLARVRARAYARSRRGRHARLSGAIPERGGNPAQLTPRGYSGLFE